MRARTTLPFVAFFVAACAAHPPRTAPAVAPLARTAPVLESLTPAQLRDAWRAEAPVGRAAIEAARERVAAGERVAPGDPPHERVARLLRLLDALDRPAPVLLAVAARPGDEEVRLRVIERLGAMVDEVTSAQLASLYERTPQGEAGASLRGRVGFELIRRGWPAARATVLRWARRSGSMRVGRVEAETWSRAFAGCAPVPEALWRDPAPEVRALAVLAWSWTHARSEAARVQAVVNDRAPLAHPGWGPTVGAAARAALAGRALDPSIELACCCFGQ